MNPGVTPALHAYWSELVGYRERAERHRPSDPVRLAEQMRELRAQGLSDRDIAAVMRLSVPAVRQLLEGRV